MFQLTGAHKVLCITFKNVQNCKALPKSYNPFGKSDHRAQTFLQGEVFYQVLHKDVGFSQRNAPNSSQSSLLLRKIPAVVMWLSLYQGYKT